MALRTMLALLLFIAIWSATGRLTASQPDAALVAAQVESLIGRCNSAGDEHNTAGKWQPVFAVAAVASVAKMPELALSRASFRPGHPHRDPHSRVPDGAFQPSHPFTIDVPLLI